MLVPLPVEQVTPDLKQELEEWWEAVRAGKTPEDPQLGGKGSV